MNKEMAKKVLEDIAGPMKRTGGTKERNEFNKIEQDLEGEDLKRYKKIRKSIIEDKEVYEQYKTYNLALLDIIFDKENDKYNNLTPEKREECYHYDKRSPYDMAFPDTNEAYYLIIKEFVSRRMMDPGIIISLNEYIAEDIANEIINNENIN